MFKVSFENQLKKYNLYTPLFKITNKNNFKDNKNVQKIKTVVIIQVPNPKKSPNTLPDIKPIKGKNNTKLYIMDNIILQ